MSVPPKIRYVVVTGAGGEPEGNPSPAVRDSLPSELSLDDGTMVKILKYPRERTCSFREMRETNEEIWSNDPSVFGEATTFAGGRLPYIDLVLHIGKCTQKKPGYWVESVARRDVYKGVDDEGQTFPPGQTGPGGIWERLPDRLSPCFDIDKAANTIGREHPDVISGRSDDAGASFCELELFSSLAVCVKRREALRAAFFHIPPRQLPQDIQAHTAVTVTLIKALVA
ncbi:hypothetical protein GGS23DRAFT_353078 [Durotheca rogersii]|uniref:uncharacterized protein n=1 Tax=Durotheca rogersii TaxID=419775 RepID=UPI00221F4018|nr:uncharacterized protein GGS23DRAFT_353078 [Durotheca rogersii]KAI5865740.1 hypothetical protein GGS23DRAFT_353078 [Durotheca rogersii]